MNLNEALNWLQGLAEDFILLTTDNQAVTIYVDGVVVAIVQLETPRDPSIDFYTVLDIVQDCVVPLIGRMWPVAGKDIVPHVRKLTNTEWEVGYAGGEVKQVVNLVL